MYIKKRLGFSYAAMLIIPFIVILFSNMVLFMYIAQNTSNNSTARIIFSKVNFFNDILKSNSTFSRKVNNQILKNPDGLLQKGYIYDLEKSVNRSYSAIVIRKDDDIVYSSKDIKSKLNKIALPKFGTNAVTYANTDKHSIKTMILNQQDFYLKDGSKGTIFYILNPAKTNQYIRRNVFFIGIYILIIIALTNGILSYAVSRSIIKPLNILGHAANEIKQGNLDYQIKKRSQDEIGEVCDSFEEMRLRLKKSLELQQHYEDNRKELLSNISHDLRTPITSIKGYIEGIRDGVADTPQKMNKYIDTIYNKATYMDNLIEDLFLFSKLDLNRLPFHFQNINIVDFINDYFEEMSFDLDKNSIELKLDIPKKNIVVNADVQKIRRVFMNLIENSIKYRSGDKLKINIKLYDYENEVAIKVSDNGRGISKDALPYIFDRFYRQDASRDTTTGGSGLGLAIVKKIIDEHNGRIWAESEAGCGTNMFFTLLKE
ncbi:sensor histidine kinase [Clostridium oryzae]|uniref:histidine kinase n=1 Tax=Clostridium oryzae TaxID=1450648 RepID=A0A1V4IFE0_9CLOT|nr:HAMP domain-containing sensor histidine kinase [Clostridium oryzae]OPJ58570.1 sensor protein kinase WalK [Clostridium oryzae]